MSVEVFTSEAATWWVGPLAVDADGAPDAYATEVVQRRLGHKALDLLANAGSEGDWYGLACDSRGDPYQQRGGDPYPGFYIPTTALQDRRYPVWDVRRYVDAGREPYLSVPRDALSSYAARHPGVTDYGLQVGDVGLAYSRHTGQACAAVVADVGPKGKWGEGSPALNRALGLPDSARDGGAAGGVVVVVFRGSAKGWPRAHQDVSQQVQDLLDASGGVTAFGLA